MGFGLLIISAAIAAQAAPADEGARSVDAVNAVEEHWSRAASKKYAATNPSAFVPGTPSPVVLHGDIAIVKHRSDKDVSVDVFQFRSGRWVALYSQHTTPVTP
jgi:hypothetical protein